MPSYYATPNFTGASVLIGTHGLVTQTLLTSVYNVRAAEIYGHSGITRERNRTLIAIAKLVTELAILCNFTPVVTDLKDIHSKKVDIHSHGSGLIIPFISPDLVSNIYNPLKHTHASIFLANYQYFNFVYCQVNRNIKEVKLNLLLQPFARILWLLISLEAVGVTLALWLLTCRKYPGNHILGLHNATFATIAGIFSTTVPWNKRSKLLLLWLLGCFILSNLYSGVLTSLLIAPLQPDVLRTVDDLKRKQYKLAYVDQGSMKNMVLMAKTMSSRSPQNSSLRWLVANILFKESLPELWKSLAFQNQVAYFAPFPAVMQYWKTLTEMNVGRGKNAKGGNIRRCYMGKELSSSYSIPESWVVIPNQGIRIGNMEGTLVSSSLLHLLHRLEANGVHSYWMQFFNTLQGSPRAQDIYRFKSRTETKEDIPVEPLGFHKGSVAVIFVLYCICAIACVIFFVSEIVWNHLTSRDRNNVIIQTHEHILIY